MGSKRVLRESRAVLRRIDPGNTGVCARCVMLNAATKESRLKFAARTRGWQVIANVYQGGQWLRVEHFHPECYEAMGQPYGQPGKPTGYHQPDVIGHDSAAIEPGRVT